MRKPNAKSTSRRLNVRVAIYLPADPDNTGNRGDYGEVTGDRQFVGYETVSIVAAAAQPKTAAGQLQTTSGFTVEMRRRADANFAWQLDVIDGAYAGRKLQVADILKDAADRADTFTLLCN